MKRVPAGLLLAASLAAALLLASCSRSEDAPVETAETGSAVEALESAPGTPETAEREPGVDVGTAEGQYPPSFTLPDLEGVSVSLDDFAGKVVVLDLWATWCPPCRAEIPVLIELQDQYGERGLEVVGIGLDQGGARILAPYVEENKIDYTILVGDRSVQQRFGVTGIPTTFFIARDGRIASKHVGFHPSMVEEMKEELEALLAAGGDA